MCGIAGIYLKNRKAKGVSAEGIERFCDRLLLEIEHRGKHATGYVSIGWDNSVKLDKSDKCATDFVKEREPFQDGIQAVLLHTRFWTKGVPSVMGNNHPVSYNTCFTVHNGSIWNDDDLFEDEELKRNFSVDSEIIPAVLDKHGLDSPETIREALEKLGGAMAIATVDPVRNPGKLLLARGDSSPLHVFENDNCIVWASEHNAIKETWGDLIGTPPKSDKIKYVKEGVFFIAEGHGALTPHEFKVKGDKPRPAVVHNPYGFRRPWGQRDAEVFHRPWDVDGPFNSIGEFKTAVADFRKTTTEVLARRWDLRESYDDDTDFTDVDGTLTWPNCICGHGILMEDMVTHFKYKLICKDCHAVCVAKWLENGRTEAEEDDSPIAGIAIPEIPEVDRKNLESWARTESTIHRYVLADLSDYTNFSMEALDFLLFRTGTKSGDFGVNMTLLKYKLQQAYEKISEEISTHNWGEIQREVELGGGTTTEQAQEMADQQQYPWSAYSEQTMFDQHPRTMYVCEIHGERFSYGEHCKQCVWDDYEEDHENWGSEDARVRRDAEEDMGFCEGDEACGVEIVKYDPVGVQKCECGMWFLDTCVNCASAAKEEPEAEVVVTVTEVECCCKTTRDRKCKRPLKLVVQNSLIGKQKGYCSQHWNKCNSSKCGKEANFTALDGQRYCHKDSRGRQGIADVAAQHDGSTSIIMEVK